MLGRKIISIKNSFKRSHKKKERSTTKKRDFVVTGVLVVITIAFLSFSIPVSLLLYNFELSSNYGVEKGEAWDYRSKFKILLVGVDQKDGSNSFVDGLALLTVSPSSGEVSIVNINPDILVYDSKENKPITLRRALLVSDNIDILIGLSEELLATKIDRYFLIKEDFFRKTSEYTNNIAVTLPKRVDDTDVNIKKKWGEGTVKLDSVDFFEFIQSDNNGRDDQLYRQVELYRNYTKSVSIYKILFSMDDFLEIVNTTVDTNLSKMEIIALFRYLKSVPPDTYHTAYTKEIYLSNLGKAGVYNVFSVNYSLLDQDMGTILRDKNVQLEQAIVEVQNASNVGGLASKKSRWISNMGAEVAHIANAPYTEEKTKVYIKDPSRYPNTIKQLKKIFSENTEFIESEYKYRHIGEIVIVIGKKKLIIKK